MGRAMRIDVDGMKKGEWAAEEDQKLVAYISQHGFSDWRSLPKRAGLQRCGKSCRLRWLNYLRPGIKRGKFTPQEEEDIIKLHALLGNRWAAIARKMENRTDNDIKNHWNSCLKKRLLRNGIDPKTHKPIIINSLTVKTTNEEYSSSITTTSTSIESPSSSSSSASASASASARLLNKLAAGISSRQHNLDRIKNIFNNRSSDQDEEEEERESMMIDENIVGGEENEFSVWDDEEVRRFMETDVMVYETTSYNSVLYANTYVLDHFFDSI